MVITMRNTNGNNPKIVKTRSAKRKTKNPIVLTEKKEIVCQYCHKIFTSENRVLRHLCEQRRRYQQKDSLFARYGLEAFIAIQHTFFGKNKKITEEDFRKSDFYLACVRWGHFVIDIACLDFQKYLSWLLNLNIPLDKWNKEEIYDCWLQAHVFIENHWEAFERSIKTLISWGEETGNPYELYFNNAGTARIITDIRRGAITGWLIFCSKTGRKWLANINKSDLELIWEWINPARWKIALEKSPIDTNEMTKICEKTNL